jgi:hypothetical protein
MSPRVAASLALYPGTESLSCGVNEEYEVRSSIISRAQAEQTQFHYPGKMWFQCEIGPSSESVVKMLYSSLSNRSMTLESSIDRVLLALETITEQASVSVFSVPEQCRSVLCLPPPELIDHSIWFEVTCCLGGVR